jgi:hypothetical protein
MTTLIFGTRLDDQQISRVSALLGGVKITGYAYAGALREPELVGQLKRTNIAAVADLLFHQPMRLRVIYTFIETEVEEARTFPLYLSEQLDYMGVLNEQVADDEALIADVQKKHWDMRSLREAANCSYIRMPDGRRIRDIVLAEMNDTNLRTSAMQKGCGKKCLTEMVNKLQDEINSVQLVLRLTE